MTLLGVMGEAPKLAAKEARVFLRRALARVRGRVPVVVGVSAAGFAPMTELAASAMDEGAAGGMVAPPAQILLKHEDWPDLAKIAALRAASDRAVSEICGVAGSRLHQG
jgi:dihydrodipicolinate synthase/N-acetylneuraminate lyase